MKTDPNKTYNLRNMDAASKHPSYPMTDGWYGRSRQREKTMRSSGSGKAYHKRLRGGSLEYKGGPALDEYLATHPNVRAYPVGENEPLQAERGGHGVEPTQ